MITTPVWPRFASARASFTAIALLPLADGRVSIVWSTTPERAAQLLELDDERFRAAVGEASDGREALAEEWL